MSCADAILTDTAETDIELGVPLSKPKHHRKFSVEGGSDGVDVIARTRDRTPEYVVRNFDGELQEVRVKTGYIGRVCTRGCVNYWVVAGVLFTALVFSAVMAVLALTGAFGEDPGRIVLNAMLAIFMFIVGVFIPQPERQREPRVWARAY